jgi:hypothetical protein
MSNFDRREVGYEKIEVPIKFIKFHPEVLGSTAQTIFDLRPNEKVWLYVPIPSQNMHANENHPLLQSYVDTVLQGCLMWGGEDMAEEVILTTLVGAAFISMIHPVAEDRGFSVCNTQQLTICCHGNLNSPTMEIGATQKNLHQRPIKE